MRRWKKACKRGSENSFHEYLGRSTSNESVELIFHNSVDVLYGERLQTGVANHDHKQIIDAHILRQNEMSRRADCGH